jgi:hypothetical protein
MSKSMNLKFDIVSGDKISEIYNISPEKLEGQLKSSCMQGKNIFDIYVKNPNVIKLATLMEGDKIIARSLLFKNISDSKWYYSRIYHSSEKWGIRIEMDLIEKGYLPIKPMVSVKLDKWLFDYYPYVDKLRYLDFKVGQLMTGEVKSGKVDYNYKYIITLDDIGGEPQSYADTDIYRNFKFLKMSSKVKSYIKFWD